MAESDVTPIIENEEERKCKLWRNCIFATFKSHSSLTATAIVTVTSVAIVVFLILHFSTFSAKKIGDDYNMRFLRFEKDGDIARIAVQPANSTGHLAIVEPVESLVLDATAGGVIAAHSADGKHITVDTIAGLITMSSNATAPATYVWLRTVRESEFLNTSDGVVVNYGRGCTNGSNANRRSGMIARKNPCFISIQTGKSLGAINVTLDTWNVELESRIGRVVMYYAAHGQHIDYTPNFSPTFVKRGRDGSTVEVTAMPATTVLERRNSAEIAIMRTSDSYSVDLLSKIQPDRLLVDETVRTWWPSDYMTFEDGVKMTIITVYNDSFITLSGSFFGDQFCDIAQTGPDRHTRVARVNNGCAQVRVTNPADTFTCTADTFDVEVDAGRFALAEKRFVTASKYLNSLTADLVMSNVNMTDGTETTSSPTGERYWYSPLGALTLINNTITDISLVVGNLTRLAHDWRQFNVLTPSWSVGVARAEPRLLARSRGDERILQTSGCHFASAKLGDSVCEISDENGYTLKGGMMSIAIKNNVAVVKGHYARVTISPFPSTFYAIN